jgi:pSer/pThr/pTyr-binding forkhead associated (FHA) protein
VIRKDGQGFLIEDLDSRNSTFVNNVPVKERLLADGDQIRIGKSTLVFQGLATETADVNASLKLDTAPTPGGHADLAKAGCDLPTAYAAACVGRLRAHGAGFERAPQHQQVPEFGAWTGRTSVESARSGPRDFSRRPSRHTVDGGGD